MHSDTSGTRLHGPRQSAIQDESCLQVWSVVRELWERHLPSAEPHRVHWADGSIQLEARPVLAHCHCRFRGRRQDWCHICIAVRNPCQGPAIPCGDQKTACLSRYNWPELECLKYPSYHVSLLFCYKNKKSNPGYSPELPFSVLPLGSKLLLLLSFSHACIPLVERLQIIGWWPSPLLHSWQESLPHRNRWSRTPLLQPA